VPSRAAEGLFIDQVKDRLAEARVIGFEETKRHGCEWPGRLHCARTGKYTLITCHSKPAGHISTMPGIVQQVRPYRRARRLGTL